MRYTDQEDGDSEDSQRTRSYDDHQADLVLDEAHWSLMTAEQKICANTGSFTVPRDIEGNPVLLGRVKGNQVSSAERYKHVNNEMFMNGSQDSDSHSPLMVYIRSKSATSKRSSERYQEYINKKQSSWTPQEYKGYNKQWGHQKQWKDYSTSTWNDYGDYGSQSDSSRRWYRRSD